MEGGRSSSILLLMAVVVGTFPACWASDFYVGGQAGWVPNPPVSFNQWAQMNRFQINDKLVFKYKNGEDYESCNVSTPIKKLDSGESSVFQLDRPGVFFSISGVPGRCQQAQKLIVAVIAPRSSQRIAPASCSITVGSCVASFGIWDGSGSVSFFLGRRCWGLGAGRIFCECFRCFSWGGSSGVGWSLSCLNWT